MPLQNRVTPFGDIVAIPQRGMFTGNRGIIHDPATKTLLTKRWASRAWLICTCDYKGVRRDVMAGRSWTELFFLDEATALSAGHRPCFLCRREAAEDFAHAWMRAKAAARPSVRTIDDQLHQERLEGRAKRLHPLDAPVEDLPDGTMIAVDQTAYLIWSGETHAWTEEGYEPATAIEQTAALLTPPSTLAVLRAGYSLVAHSSLHA
ncbi:hypothetical protein BH10PSE4_BH10PSE4_32050 [soil metagenome]